MCSTALSDHPKRGYFKVLSSHEHACQIFQRLLYTIHSSLRTDKIDSRKILTATIICWESFQRVANLSTKKFICKRITKKPNCKI